MCTGSVAKFLGYKQPAHSKPLVDKGNGNFLPSWSLASIRKQALSSYHLDFADFADLFVVAKLLHLPEALLRVRYPPRIAQPLVLDGGIRDQHPDGSLDVRTSSNKTQPYYDMHTSSASRREQCTQTLRRMLTVDLMKPTWKTGLASSMWPKCPGQSLCPLLQLMHLYSRSVVPIRGSARPSDQPRKRVRTHNVSKQATMNYNRPFSSIDQHIPCFGKPASYVSVCCTWTTDMSFCKF